MAPAVTATLGRAIDSSRPYIAGRVWKLAELCEVSNRAGSPYFGCRRSHSGRIPGSRRRHMLAYIQ